MKNGILRTLLGLFIAGGAVVLVFNPLNASDDEQLRTQQKTDVDDLRDQPLTGETWILDELKTRGWSAIRGTIEERLTLDGAPTRHNIILQDGNYVAYTDGKLTSAWVDRVLVNLVGEDEFRISDQRFTPCRRATSRLGAAGETYAIEGAPYVEPRPGELSGLTNDEAINRMVAPSYWVRSVFEVSATKIEVQGQENVAGRPTYRARVQEQVAPRDGRSSAVTIWADLEHGVILRWVNEGRAPETPDSEEMVEFRQEWNFTSVAFDDEVAPLDLLSVEIPAGATVDYSQLSEHGDGDAAGRFVAEVDETVASIVRAAVEKQGPKEDPVTTCQSSSDD